MRRRYLFLALAIAFSSFAALIFTLPSLAAGQAQWQQLAGEEPPVPPDGADVLGIYILPDGQVQITAAHCQECTGDPRPSPQFPPPRFPITRPYSLAQPVAVPISLPLIFNAITDTNVTVAAAPGALILDGVAAVDCVSAAPDNAVAAEVLIWEGPTNCPAILDAMAVYRIKTGAPLTYGVEAFVRRPYITQSSVLTMAGAQLDGDISIRFGADDLSICTNCLPDPPPVPTCGLFPCCPWPLSGPCDIAGDWLQAPENRIDDTLLEYMEQMRGVQEFYTQP